MLLLLLKLIWCSATSCGRVHKTGHSASRVSGMSSISQNAAKKKIKICVTQTILIISRGAASISADKPVQMCFEPHRRCDLSSACSAFACCALMFTCVAHTLPSLRDCGRIVRCTSKTLVEDGCNFQYKHRNAGERK